MSLREMEIVVPLGTWEKGASNTLRKAVVKTFTVTSEGPLKGGGRISTVGPGAGFG